MSKLFGGPDKPEASLGESGVKKAPKWPFFPPTWVFSAFFAETSKNHSYCATTGVKKHNLANKNQNVSKWSSSEEIRVWQLSLFTYLLLKMKKVSKDKDTNFILAIFPSDWLLAKTQAVKPVKRKKNVRGIRYIKQKTLKSYNVKETLKSWRKTLIGFEK